MRWCAIGSVGATPVAMATAVTFYDPSRLLLDLERPITVNIVRESLNLEARRLSRISKYFF